MPFPESPRVLYTKNPLDQVICQLRFPPVLRIATELPVAFQDRIRDRFPLFGQKPLVAVPPQLAQLGIQVNVGAGDLAYEFASGDGAWDLSLTKDFLALTAHRYQRWEEFRAELRIPLTVLSEIYGPAFFSRIGLRYQDVIVRSQLGLDDVPWAELLQPHAAADLADPQVGAAVVDIQRRTEFKLSRENARVRLLQGLVQQATSGEICYLIDSDFFIDVRVETTDVEATLDYLHGQAGHLFHWCITPRLHEAMGPSELPRVG